MILSFSMRMRSIALLFKRKGRVLVHYLLFGLCCIYVRDQITVLVRYQVIPNNNNKYSSSSGLPTLLSESKQYHHGQQQQRLQEQHYHNNGNNNDINHNTASESTTATRPEPFHPWDDLSFTPLHRDGQQQPLPYSSYSCVSTGTQRPNEQEDPHKGARPNWFGRTCWYRNLYYAPATKDFHYYASPQESIMLRLESKQQNRNNNTSTTTSTTSSNALLRRRQVALFPSSDMTPAYFYRKAKMLPWMPIMHLSSTIHDTVSSSWPYNPTTTTTANATNATTTATVTILGPSNLHMLLYRPFHSFNIGHFVWDDMLAWFSMLDLFHLGDDDSIQPLPFYVEAVEKDAAYLCSPALFEKWNSCVKTYRKMFPTLMGVQTHCSGDVLRTGNWLQGPNAAGNWKGREQDGPNRACTAQQQQQQQQQSSSSSVNISPSTYIVIPNVTAGMGRLNSFGCQSDCSLGRGPQLLRFRNFLIRRIFGPVRGRELIQTHVPEGWIVFSLSMNSTRPEHITDFSNEIAAARATYGSHAVKVLNMATLTWQEQAMVAMNAAALFTNHGGVSVVATFLPPHASVMVYWHGEIRFDHAFFESAGYLRPVFIGMDDRPYWNRTMAILGFELEKTALHYSTTSLAYMKGPGSGVFGQT